MLPNALRKTFLAVLASGCLAAAVPAQQHAFRQLGPQDGLAQSQVRCMAQDAAGYLWFGTLGGASRYDGHQFTNYALQEGLPDPQVSAMAQDDDGTLWMASGHALLHLDGGRMRTEILPAVPAGVRIMALAADGAGRLFAGTDGAGLYLRDAQGIRPMPGYPADTAAHIRALLALPDGRLLIGLRNGLLIWDGSGFGKVALGEGPPMAVSALAAGNDGAWWVGTFVDGLIRITPDGQRTLFDEESGLLRNNVRCLLVDRGGRLWVGCKFGLTLFDGQRTRVFTVHQGLPNDNIWCALEDGEGNLWFGTDGAGALRYAGDRFVTFTVKDGLCSDLVMTATADAQGDIWLGTYDNGVCRMDGMAMVNTLDGLPNNTVWCSLTDRNGVLWFGTSDGLAMIERGRVLPLPPNASLAGQRVLALQEDAQGRIWAGMRDGVAMIGPDLEVTLHAVDPNGPGRSVRSIARDDRDHLWFASDQGVSRFDGKRFSTLTTSDGLSDNTVFSLLVDHRGRIWAGTANGLTCLHDGTITVRRFAPDFGSNYVDLLIGDNTGRIWAGTNNGLFLFHPDSLLADPAAHQHFTTDQGLRSLEFNLNAGYKDARGRLLLGTTGGLVYHDLQRRHHVPTTGAPRLHLTGIRSYLQHTDWKGQCDSLDAAGLPIGLRLPYGRNHITFDYTAISLSDPQRVHYQYRLLGLHDDWLPTTEARFASFSNLRQGDYSFEVMAAVGDGPWSIPASFSFRIAPPFWLRGWFFLLCALVAAGGLGIIQRFRSVRRARNERTRQLMLRSRMLQLEQQALNANMNRHFVFNALNSIQYHINKQDRATASRYLTSFAKLIRKNLDASQNDTTTLAEELERLELYLLLEHMRFKDRFRYHIHVDPAVDTHHVHLPAMMLQPYVENSIWHGILPTERQGEVSIHVEPAGVDRVRVRIEDDGIGVEQSRSNKRGMESDHISRGIEITKGRADVLRKLDLTDIRITGPDQRQDPVSGTVQGTRVSIELPCSDRS